MIATVRQALARECELLVYRAARFTDSGEWEGLASLFADDGVLLRPSAPTVPIIGRENIRQSLQARPTRTTRHLLTNVIVDIQSTSAAHISSAVVLFTGPASLNMLPVTGSKILVGNFEDDVALGAQGWQFVKRDGSMALDFDWG
jgi:hypothetical protein